MKILFYTFLLFLAVCHGVEVLEQDQFDGKVAKRRGLLVAVSIIVGAIIGGAVSAVVGAAVNAGIDAAGGGRRIVVVVEDGNGNVIGEGVGRRELGENLLEGRRQLTKTDGNGGNQAGAAGPFRLSEEALDPKNDPWWDTHVKVIRPAQAKGMIQASDPYGEQWNINNKYIIPMQVTAIEIRTGNFKLQLPPEPWFDPSKWAACQANAGTVDLSNIAPQGWNPNTASDDRSEVKVAQDRASEGRQAVELSEAANTETDMLPLAAAGVASMALVLVFYRMCMGRKTKNQYAQLVDEIDEL